MNWQPITTEADWQSIIAASEIVPQLVYKHSTRCSISSVAKSRLERSAIPPGIQLHYLDLIKYRSLSNMIAEDTGVRHESPQVLLMVNGKCIYNESHMGINMDDIAGALR